MYVCIYVGSYGELGANPNNRKRESKKIPENFMLIYHYSELALGVIMIASQNIPPFFMFFPITPDHSTFKPKLDIVLSILGLCSDLSTDDRHCSSLFHDQFYSRKSSSYFWTIGKTLARLSHILARSSRYSISLSL